MQRVLLAGLVMLAVLPAFAQSERRFGAGLGIGDPTGLYLKYWLSDANAIDAALGFPLSDDSSVQLHADYLWHRYEWVMPQNLRGTLPVYFGVGARLLFMDDDDDNGRGNNDNDDDDHFGIRLPIGLNYLPYAGNFDFFAELAPVLDVTPDADLDLNIAVGARYYF